MLEIIKTNTALLWFTLITFVAVTSAILSGIQIVITKQLKGKK
jgi:hypothetical protein